MNNDYPHYSEEDFIEDAYFRQWVQRPDYHSNLFWKHFLAQYPDRNAVIEKARKLLLSMEFDQPYLPEEKVNRMWENIYVNLDEASPTPGSAKKKTSLLRLYPVWQKVAAVFLILSLLGATYWITEKYWSQDRYSTAYGETRTITLPDGSTVVLNAHSSIKFSSDWTNQPVREVWLDGEAFFSVVRKTISPAGSDRPVRAKFQVYTGEVTVEVLGTQFNVSKRRENTEVVLKEGKVKLNVNAKGKTEDILMQPGEQVAFSGSNGQWTKRTVDAEALSAWRNKKWILEETPLKQVALMIEEAYGLEVVLTDEQIKNRKVTGTIPTNDLNSLLDALSVTLKVKVTRHGNQITIQE